MPHSNISALVSIATVCAFVACSGPPSAGPKPETAPRERAEVQPQAEPEAAPRERAEAEPPSPGRPAGEGWTSIFNGTDLAG
jgi:hypothetical protein